jgi:hypothetical protein
MFWIAKHLTPEEKIEFNRRGDYHGLTQFNDINNFTIPIEYKKRFNIDEQYFKDLYQNGEHKIVCGGVFEIIDDNKKEYQIAIQHNFNQN